MDLQWVEVGVNEGCGSKGVDVSQQHLANNGTASNRGCQTCTQAYMHTPACTHTHTRLFIKERKWLEIYNQKTLFDLLLGFPFPSCLYFYFMCLDTVVDNLQTVQNAAAGLYFLHWLPVYVRISDFSVDFYSCPWSRPFLHFRSPAPTLRPSDQSLSLPKPHTHSNIW